MPQSPNINELKALVTESIDKAKSPEDLSRAQALGENVVELERVQAEKGKQGSSR